MYTRLVDVSLMTNEIIKEPSPELNPLITTTCSGSFTDSILVQLFSSPQHTDASKTKIKPKEKDKLLKSSTKRTMLEIVIKPIAIHNLLLINSLKKNNAISDFEIVKQ